MGAEIARRLSEYAFEHSIELGERLKPDIVSNFADSPIRIQKLCPRILKPNACDVIGKFQSGRFAEYLAKVKHAGACSFRHRGQRQSFGLVFVDVLARSLHERWFDGWALDAT